MRKAPYSFKRIKGVLFIEEEDLFWALVVVPCHEGGV
jgi:hypothetical protein